MASVANTSDVFTTELVPVLNPHYGLAALFILIVIFALFGNTLLIVAICTQKSLQRSGNMYIAGLAITDIAFTLCHIVSIHSKLVGYWDFSDVLCELNSVVIQCTAILSVMHLMVIAFHRYLYICKHTEFKTKFTVKWSLTIEIGTWIFGLTVAIPGVFFTDWEYDDRINTCVFASQDPGEWKYPLYLLCVLLFIPCPVCIWSYYKIYRYVYNMKKNLMKNDAMSRKDQNKLVQHQFQQLFSRLLVFLMFIVMYVPFLVTRVLDSLVYVPDGVHLACAAVIALNSMINPYIYGFMNKTFRDGYKNLLICRCCNAGSAYRSRSSDP